MPVNTGALPADASLIDARDELLSVDERYFVRLGWLIVLVGVMGFLGWAMLAPLDAGVPVEAKVVVSGNRKAVQPITGGRVERILVSEGQRVQAGQVLVVLEPNVAANQLDSLQFQFFSSLAMENRLMAERDGLSDIRFDERLLQAGQAGQAQGAEIIQAQRQLFDSRRRAQQITLDGLEATLRGLREQRDSLQRILQSRLSQREAFERQLAGQRSLAADGLLARNRLLESERQFLQLAGAVADDQGRLAQLQGQVQEYQLRLVQQREDYQRSCARRWPKPARVRQTSARAWTARDMTWATCRFWHPPRASWPAWLFSPRAAWSVPATN